MDQSNSIIYIQYSWDSIVKNQIVSTHSPLFTNKLFLKRYLALPDKVVAMETQTRMCNVIRHELLLCGLKSSFRKQILKQFGTSFPLSIYTEPNSAISARYNFIIGKISVLRIWVQFNNPLKSGFFCLIFIIFYSLRHTGCECFFYTILSVFHTLQRSATLCN